jgi:hypothetical protein
MVEKIETKHIKESDLYDPIKDYLEGLGYKVNGEIHSCDIVAQKETELLVVELKKQLNLEVILQAAERQKIAETVYIAVLKPDNFKKDAKYKRICHLLRRLEIGLLLVNFKKTTASVEVVQIADVFDRHKSRLQNHKKKKKIENEFLRRKTKTTGGVNKTKVMTSYKEDAILIAKEMETLDNCKPKALIYIGLPLNRIQSILYKNYYGWFNRIDKGVYEIADQWLIEKEMYF